MSERFALRGWEDKPFALRDMKSGKVSALSEDIFRALSFCNGVMDMDNTMIPDVYRKIAGALAEKGIVKPCEDGRPLSPAQRYRAHPCHFMASAFWAITGACNMSCRHCFMSAPRAKFGELSHDACMDVVRQLGEAGVPMVRLTGGEPLVRGDFLELVDALIEQNVHISEINTNGMLVDEALLDALEGRGIRPEFSLSFDGVGWHDWMRGMDGAEGMVIDTIRMLRDRGFYVAVESTFHRNSIGSAPETMMLLAELGVDEWKVAPVLNSGDWLNEDDSLNLRIEELGAAYVALIARYFEEGSPLTMMIRRFFTCFKGSGDYFVPYRKCGEESDPLCLAVRNTMYLSADGRMLPCTALSGLPIQEDMPGLSDMTVAQALSGSPYLERIETPVSALIEHNPECASCEYRRVCGGGCRAVAMSINGDNDYLGRDLAACTFFRGGYEDKIRSVAAQYA